MVFSHMPTVTFHQNFIIVAASFQKQKQTILKKKGGKNGGMGEEKEKSKTEHSP